MLTHWILIYPLDSAIHQLFEQLEPFNNSAQEK